MANIIEVKDNGLRNYIDIFLSGIDVAASSKKTYERQLRKYFSWVSDTSRDLNLLTSIDIIQYKTFLISQELSVNSINSFLTAVRRFYEYVEAEKIYPNIAKVKGLKKPRGHRKDSLSISDIRRVLNSIDRGDVRGMRDYAVINLAIRTGLRTKEISLATVEDLRKKSGVDILWIQGKGRDEKDDFVIITEDALNPILDYLQVRNIRLSSMDTPLFASLSDRNYGASLTPRSISKIIKDAFINAGLDSDRLSAHSLRHTAITLAIEGGASPVQAKEMARHSDIKTTMIYFHEMNRIENGAENYIKF